MVGSIHTPLVYPEYLGIVRGLYAAYHLLPEPDISIDCIRLAIWSNEQWPETGVDVHTHPSKYCFIINYMIYAYVLIHKLESDSTVWNFDPQLRCHDSTSTDRVESTWSLCAKAGLCRSIATTDASHSRRHRLQHGAAFFWKPFSFWSFTVLFQPVFILFCIFLSFHMSPFFFGFQTFVGKGGWAPGPACLHH